MGYLKDNNTVLRMPQQVLPSNRENAPVGRDIYAYLVMVKQAQHANVLRGRNGAACSTSTYKLRVCAPGDWQTFMQLVWLQGKALYLPSLMALSMRTSSGAVGKARFKFPATVSTAVTALIP